MRFVFAFIIVYNKTSIIEKSILLVIYVEDQTGECVEIKIIILGDKAAVILIFQLCT